MAIYRFKVYLEDNEDVFRDIDIKAAQTFEQFHTVIQEAFKFDAKHAAARGLVDAIVTPENVRNALILALETCLNTKTPHIGAFVL